MTKLIRGSDTGLSFADPTKLYWDGSKIDNLQKIGALTEADAKIGHNIDKIIDNLPVDGQDQMAELKHIQDHYHDGDPDKPALFPEEVARLPIMLRALEYQPVAEPQAMQWPQLPPLAEQVKPVFAGPGQLDMDASVEITKLTRLNDAQRDVASRVEVVNDSDRAANPASSGKTISLRDVGASSTDPGGLTEEWKRELPAIRADIERVLREQPTNISYKLEVPTPGRTFTTIPNQGSAEFRAVTDVQIQDSYNASKRCVSWARVSRDHYYEVKVPAGYQMRVRKVGEEGEWLFQPSTGNMGFQRLDLPEGRYHVDLWKLNRRNAPQIAPDGQVPKGDEDSEIIVPSRPQNQLVDIMPQLGLSMITPEGKVLKRTATQVTTGAREVLENGSYVERVSNASAVKPLDAYSTFKTDLPTGKYKITNTNLILYVLGPKTVAVGSTAGEAPYVLAPYQGRYVAKLDGRDQILYRVSAEQGYLLVYTGTQNQPVRLENRIP